MSFSQCRWFWWECTCGEPTTRSTCVLNSGCRRLQGWTTTDAPPPSCVPTSSATTRTQRSPSSWPATTPSGASPRSSPSSRWTQRYELRTCTHLDLLLQNISFLIFILFPSKEVCLVMHSPFLETLLRRTKFSLLIWTVSSLHSLPNKTRTRSFGLV